MRLNMGSLKLNLLEEITNLRAKWRFLPIQAICLAVEQSVEGQEAGVAYMGEVKR